MTTTANTLAWLHDLRKTDPGLLTYDDWSELHGMLHDLIHIDDIDTLRAALWDRDLGEASTLALDYQTERLRIAIKRAERAEEELDTLRDRDLGEAVDVERWRDIETAPTDGTPHVRGLWVNSTKAGGYTYWESIAGAIDDGEGEFLDHGGNAPWHAEDYVRWMPLPAAPDAKP